MTSSENDMLIDPAVHEIIEWWISTLPNDIKLSKRVYAIKVP